MILNSTVSVTEKCASLTTKRVVFMSGQGPNVSLESQMERLGTENICKTLIFKKNYEIKGNLKLKVV